MTSTIEESLKDYKNYLNGKPNGVEVVHATIPVKPQFNAKTIKELRKKYQRKSKWSSKFNRCIYSNCQSLGNKSK